MKRFLIIAGIASMFAVVAVGTSEASVIKKDVVSRHDFPSLAIAVIHPEKDGLYFDAMIPAQIVMPNVKIAYTDFESGAIRLSIGTRQRLRCRSPS